MAAEELQHTNYLLQRERECFMLNQIARRAEKCLRDLHEFTKESGGTACSGTVSVFVQEAKIKESFLGFLSDWLILPFCKCPADANESTN